MPSDMDKVFKALADPTRRQLLDGLHEANGQTLGELCEHLDMTRQAVTKHLAVLETANLVATVRRGREKLHYLNPVPINEIHERWIGKYERHLVQALHDLKKALEEDNHGETEVCVRDLHQRAATRRVKGPTHRPGCAATTNTKIERA